MTPLAKIKLGIETADWALVASGYADLTGDLVQIPGPPPAPTQDATPAQDSVDALTAESMRLSAAARPKEYRPAARFFDVVCGRCQKRERVCEALAPKKIGEEMSSYTCNACAVGGKR